MSALKFWFIKMYESARKKFIRSSASFKYGNYQKSYENIISEYEY